MADFRIHVLDMGDTKFGDCLVVEAGDRRILIDGGHSNDFAGQDGYDSIPEQIESILGQPSPFKFDLLIVTHVHADHIGCLPKMLAADMLDIETALVADPALGFGRIDAEPDVSADSALTQLERGLIAAGAEQDYSDLPSDEIVSFLLDAAKLEDTYKQFLSDLAEAGIKVIKYTGQSMAALEKKFSDIGLKILGPPRPHLERCARATAKAVKANAKKTRPRDGHVAADATDAVARYRMMFANRVRADATPDDIEPDFVRDGKNNTSIVVKVSVEGKSALLAGDMQFADAMIKGMEEDMLAIREVVREAGPYDVVKTSHHTSFNGLNDDVLTDYEGTTLFVHSGGRRDPDHPDAEALAVLKGVKHKIKFARTDRNGLITVDLSGTPRLELSQGKVNVFTLNPKNVPDVEPGRPLPPAATVRPIVEGASGIVEITARIPHQSTRVTLTVDVEPRHAFRAVDEPRSPERRPEPPQLRPASSLRIADGRSLPRLLFVTQVDQLSANIGKNEARQILTALGEAGLDVYELKARASSANEAAREVRSQLPGQYQGVVLLGGYDVVPPQRLDTIGDAIRAQLQADPEMGREPDDFIVWNDDGYVDFDEDGTPELPISRIPDGMSAGLVQRALTARATSSGRFGIRNLDRPFADQVWAFVPGANEPLHTSDPLTSDQLGNSVTGGYVYFMLHGDATNGRRFSGETEDGDHVKAVEIDSIKDLAGATVFAGCCWGALCGERLANDPAPIVPRAVGNSLAMTCLAAGARAFIGATGVHYSPEQDEYLAGRPLHEFFWDAVRSGRDAPAEALFEAKKNYAARLRSVALPTALHAIERKIYGEFTCLGLGW